MKCGDGELVPKPLSDGVALMQPAAPAKPDEPALQKAGADGRFIN